MGREAPANGQVGVLTLWGSRAVPAIPAVPAVNEPPIGPIASITLDCALVREAAVPCPNPLELGAAVIEDGFWAERQQLNPPRRVARAGRGRCGVFIRIFVTRTPHLPAGLASVLP